jgi:hypothetical protein
MKSSYAALTLLGCLLAGLWYAGGGAAPPAAEAAGAVRVSQPVTHDNLTVYFVHGPDAVADAKVATLQEALEAGWAVVHETGDVNQLAVENRSADTELFIQEGDIIKGGKQDRMIAVDMLLPPNSGRVPFPAHCVEQGRWTARGQEVATQFHASTKFAVGNEIKYANATYQQGEVWKNVAVAQEKLSRTVGVRVNAEESASSLQLALENRAVEEKVAEYERALKAACEKRKNVVGVVFVVNGTMTGAEVYGSSALFQKAWPKLLNSAATEALAEKGSGQQAAAPSAREVERFLALGGEQEKRSSSEGNSQQTGGAIADYPPSRGVVIRGSIDPPDVEIPQLPVNVTEFSGRSAATRTRILRSGGAQLNNPASLHDPGEPFQTEGRVQLFQTEGRPAGNTAPNQAPEVRGWLEAVRPLNPPTAAAPALNAAGNRLNINRVGNAAGLVTESRDPARGNAVIHKSYIRK